MKKHLNLASFALLAGVVTAVAQYFAGKDSASWLITHQPEAPKCLSK